MAPTSGAPVSGGPAYPVSPADQPRPRDRAPQPAPPDEPTPTSAPPAAGLRLEFRPGPAPTHGPAGPDADDDRAATRPAAARHSGTYPDADAAARPAPQAYPGPAGPWPAERGTRAEDGAEGPRRAPAGLRTAESGVRAARPAGRPAGTGVGAARPLGAGDRATGRRAGRAGRPVGAEVGARPPRRQRSGRIRQARCPSTPRRRLRPVPSRRARRGSSRAARRRRPNRPRRRSPRRSPFPRRGPSRTPPVRPGPPHRRTGPPPRHRRTGPRHPPGRSAPHRQRRSADRPPSTSVRRRPTRPRWRPRGRSPRQPRPDRSRRRPPRPRPNGPHPGTAGTSAGSAEPVSAPPAPASTPAEPASEAPTPADPSAQPGAGPAIPGVGAARAEPLTAAAAPEPDTIAEAAEPAEPPAPDPEQALAAFRWRLDPATLREEATDPAELRVVRDGLTGRLGTALDNRSRARLLSLRSVASRILGDLDDALADGRLAVTYAEATGELRRTALARARLAQVLRWRGEHTEADRLFAQANSPELPDRLRAALHEHAGRSCFDQGRLIEACHHFERALDLRQGADPELVARTGVALDAVRGRAAAGGFGPWSRDRDAMLRGERPPAPTFDEELELWGYADAEGDLVIDHRYAEVQPFHEGLAWVRRPEASRWALIDTSGAALIEANNGYRAVGAFSEGLAWVSMDGKGNWMAVEPDEHREGPAGLRGRPPVPGRPGGGPPGQLGRGRPGRSARRPDRVRLPHRPGRRPVRGRLHRGGPGGGGGGRSSGSGGPGPAGWSSSRRSGRW